MPLRGNWLRVARSLWLAVATLAVSIVVASVIVRLQAFDTLYPSSLPSGWTPELLSATLAQLGLSPRFFIVYNLVFAYLLFLCYAAIALLIFWRCADDWMALLGVFA